MTGDEKKITTDNQDDQSTGKTAGDDAKKDSDQNMAGSDQSMDKSTPFLETIGGMAGSTASEVDERAQRLIGRKLTRYYSTLVAEPVPEAFIDLLRRLDAKEDGS